jgi:pimeloyl-ACP methyl ester carboxylesterase
MPFAERQGYRLHYELFGAEESPPLLLIMGLGLAADAWSSLPGRLADRFRVIVFSNRGMGQSTAPAGGFRIADLAADAASVLDELRVEQAFVFGISMGGMIAQELALRHPARVRSLVLGATFCSQWSSHKPALTVAADLLLVSLSYRHPKRMARLMVSDAFFAAERERFVGWLGKLSHPPPSVARRQIVAITRHETEERLKELKVPTLVITGTLDRLVPPQNSRHLATLIPGARLLELPGVGHAFPFEREDQTVSALTGHFLP